MQQQLFSKIFNFSGSQTESNIELESILKEHPYFGLAQFYQLKNMPATEVSYSETAARTNLFFNDPFFLNAQLLTGEKLAEQDITITPEFVSPEAVFMEESEKTTINEVIVEEVINPVTIANSNDTALIHQSPVNSPVESEILFEPLHASDYFASQGIKLSDDALANDKLGKQLKSFTAWLKTMKKVHPDKLPAATAILETSVQKQAEKSNIEEEIVTEPMAEAYVQQHKYGKAVEIYSKLSLLNPAKSAYFAAKIDSLKK